MAKNIRPLDALVAAGAASVLVLAGCSSDDSASTEASSTVSETSSSVSATSTEGHDDMDDMDDADDHGGHGDHGDDAMAGHDHPADGGPAPEGMIAADNAKFPVGSEVQVLADHMPGMKGAEGKVVGVFNTTTYSVSYTPTDGSEPVKDHRWVVHEELENPGEAPLADGSEITINAEHMAGMKGAKGTVDYSTQEPVYMVDIDDDGMTMKNHKWVTESELAPED
ncbi:YdhK family protein [Corynebacterium sp. MSK151]|uniref:YdhK family protein n=2 Tax=Corynebacterium TaxID=1716 RepID=UPI000AF167DC|nr:MULTISPECIES: YdhK family protein [unclassified Corynebacterium]MDK8758123.1 YdhK family protein [Corynebacterium sp. MSK151]MDK8847010.1 YdhK family protein [Corynebacterium sp. MSK047]